MKNHDSGSHRGLDDAIRWEEYRMAFIDHSLQQVNLRLILLLNMRTDREEWQKKTLYSILPGAIQSQSSFAEGKGYYLDVSWIEYGDAAGGWH